MADPYLNNELVGREIPRTSAGPDFQHIPPPSEAFLRAVRTCFTSSNSEPRGIANPGPFCYRNASLSMLLRSERFLSFIRNWHLHENILPNLQDVLADKHIACTTGFVGLVGAVVSRTGPVENHDLLTHLNDIARGLESRPIAGARPNDTVLNTTEDQRIESAISKFWRTFCAPAAGQYLSNTPQKTFWSNDRDLSDHQDAQEFLSYVIESIAAQLGHYAQNGPVTYQQDLFKSLIYMRQAERFHCKNCEIQVRQRKASLADFNCLQIPFDNAYLNRSLQDLRTPETLQSLLKRVSNEPLEKECPRCKNKGLQEKHVTIQTTPEILLICIGRTLFGTKSRGRPRVYKNLQAVSIPDVLDVTDWLEPSKFGSDSVVKYRLSGVTSHSGSDANSGHYVSYVRGGVQKDQWYEVNDKTVTACDPASFNEAIPVPGMSLEQFEDRLTPYLLLYELDTKLSWTSDGRKLMNIGEGSDKDEQPTTYLTGKQGQPNKPATDLLDGDEWQYVNSMENETAHPKAVMNVAVEIDNEIFKLPRTFIEHFNAETPRIIEIKASIESPWDRTNVADRRILDLAKAHVDAEIQWRSKNRNKKRPQNAQLPRPRGVWRSRWGRKT